MLRKIFASFAGFILSFGAAFAFTDPEPNPFAALQTGERVLSGEIAKTENGRVEVKTESGAVFVGEFGKILKYRDAGGPAAAEEFFAGDSVRFIGTAANGIAAIQNADIVKCGIEFYGRVESPSDSGFTLRSVDGSAFQIRIGAATPYRDEAGKLLIGYRPRAGDAVRVHGAFNTNQRIAFAETLGSSISILSDAALEIAAEQLPPFADISLDNPAAESIRFVKKAGIVAGYPDGSFRPESKINRAEFLKILIAARFGAEQPAVSNPCFSDFAATDWFAPFVCAAKEKQVISGYPDGSFRPANSINIAEAAKIISQSYSFELRIAAAGEAWFAPAIEFLAQKNILPAELAANPAAELTRAQMAELIFRAEEFVKNNSQPAAASS